MGAMGAMMTAQLWSQVVWDVARAGGFVAYVLLTLSVVLGLALSRRWQHPRWPRLVTNELHSYVTLLALVFTSLHTLAVWLDPFTRFAWRDVLVPLATWYRPLWMAAGIVGTYLLLAIWISSQVRPRLGYAWWRRLHTLTFAVYVLATVHGLGAGTDTRQPWALELYAGSALLVGALLIQRLLTPAGTRGRVHPRLATLTALLLVGGIAWAATGPARAGWATGTLAGHGTTARAAARPQPTSPAPAQSNPGASSSGSGSGSVMPSAFVAGLQGTATETAPDAHGASTLRIAATLDDGAGRTLAISLQGTADGSVSATHMTLTDGATAYAGPLSTLSGERRWRLSARLTAAGTHSALDVAAVLAPS